MEIFQIPENIKEIWKHFEAAIAALEMCAEQNASECHPQIIAWDILKFQIASLIRDSQIYKSGKSLIIVNTK